MRYPILLFCLAVASSGAQAGRPLVTEDAGVLEQGDCEWESVAEREATSGEPRATSWSTQVGCGIGFDTQLAAAYGHGQAGGETDHNLYFGGKTGLIDGGEDGASLTLAYGAALLRQAPMNIRFRFDSAFANLVLTAPLAEDWTGHANLGAAYYRDGHVTRATWAVAVENDLGDSFGWGAETFGEEADRPWLGAGIRWDATKTLNLNASAAVQRGEPRSHLFTIGLKLAF
jgi:hypothetical protein